MFHVCTLFVQESVCVGDECSLANHSEYIATKHTPSAALKPAPETGPAKSTPHRALTGKNKQVTQCTSDRSISVLDFLNLL